MLSMPSAKVLVTGSAHGIGYATAKLFAIRGYSVIGIDILPSTINRDNYIHIQYDLNDFEHLPDISDINVLVNNAGVQNTGHDIRTNLESLIACTEKYGVCPSIKSIVNVASVSAHNGAEFPEYCASKGGMLSYTKNVAKRVAKFGATCNSISPGGVITELNRPVMDDADKWAKIMDETPLRKWASAEEIAQWIYFMSIINTSMTGQDIIVDNGEMINHTFIW